MAKEMTTFRFRWRALCAVWRASGVVKKSEFTGWECTNKLNQMLKERRIKRVGYGLYELMPKRKWRPA